MSSTSSSTGVTPVERKLVVSSSDESQKTMKENKSPKTVGIISCSMCTKTFVTDSSRIQHEEAKHNAGTSVETFSTTSTNDAHSHSQPSNRDNRSASDLIALSDDDDDYCYLSQPNLPTLSIETNLLVDINDDSSNTAEFSSELSDTVRLRRCSPDNDKAPEITVPKHKEEDEELF